MNARSIARARLLSLTGSALAKPPEDPRVAYANRVLSEYRWAAPTNRRVLHVPYFCPADRSPAPAYHQRPGEIMREIPQCYRKPLRSYGQASDGISLRLDDRGNLVIHPVTGKRPART
jgi:hypothetical protein